MVTQNYLFYKTNSYIINILDIITGKKSEAFLFTGMEVFHSENLDRL